MARQPGTAFIQMGHDWETYYERSNKRTFDVASTGPGGVESRQLAANQVVSVTCGRGVQRAVVSTTSDLDLAEKLGHRLTVYESQSVVRRIAGRMASRC